MKKVLILTTSTGQGHNQAANSLVEVFKDNGYEVIKHDFLENNSKFLNETIVKGYEISATILPRTYGFFYNLTNHKYIKGIFPIIFRSPIRKIRKLLLEKKPDIIVATHPFAVNIICSIKAKGINIPFISVVTDFKAHYTYVNPLVDAYITASNYTKKSLTDRGIKENKVFPIGIPINKLFFNSNKDIPTIKDTEYFSLLLMSGSMGLKKISYVLDELLKNKHKLRITVICGNNHKLKNSLEKKAQHNFKDKKLHIVGFTKDVNSFMEYSDIIVSKPGGLTVTESIAKNLPLIIPFVIPGQEMENTDFLVKNDFAFYIKHLKDLNSLIDKLIENPEILIKMGENINSLASTYSIDKVIEISNKLIEKK